MSPLSARLLGRAFPLWLTLYCTALGYAQVPVNYGWISNQAQHLFQQRDYAAAGAILEDGLAHATRENKTDWEAVMLGLLGPVYQKMGKYTQAEDALNRSIDNWTRFAGPNAPTLVSSLGSL